MAGASALLPTSGVTGRSRTRRLADACYLAAVVAINVTLFRPSPVDVMFVLALALALVSQQVVTRNAFIFLVIMAVWVGSLLLSSISLVDDPEVTYQMVKISFAVSIGLSSSLVASLWRAAEFERFLDVLVAATVLAACLGTLGFLMGIEDLTWDGRAKGFLDDPNMYGAFLVPGILASMYKLAAGGSRLLYGAAGLWLVLGLLLSFSRAAIVSCLIWGAAYYLVLHRGALGRAVMRLAVVAVAVAAILGAASLSIDGFADKLEDRSTVAKSYDLGHGGRYGRYAQSVPYILDNPTGVGLLQSQYFFEEPIHNIWLSSFMNYGWTAGIAFTLLLMFTVAISLFNYRATGSPLAIVISFAWLAVVSCAFLHEAERWRHLWMFTGLVWGFNARLLVHRPARDEASPVRA